MISLTNRHHCGNNVWVDIIAHDPLSNQPILVSWSLKQSPDAVLIPNGSPEGFTIRAWCKEYNIVETHIPHIEMSCRGAKKHTDDLNCMTAIVDHSLKRHRVVRTPKLYHRIPI